MPSAALPGEERAIRLELRLIADVGLVGLPNAGKSTLLAALTAATPKIADYPFTTLEPNLGVMDLGMEDGRRPTIADVPGLIEGASSGAGLGHAFLRHVERTRILIHVVDGASRDPKWDHDVIRDELGAHDPALLEKPILVAFNKMDLAAAREAWPAFRASLQAAGIDAVAISADSGDGLDALRAAVSALLPDADGLAEPPEPGGRRRPPARGGERRVRGRRTRTSAYRVSGQRIERLVAQTNFENEESAERFQRELVRTGIDGALRKAGIRPATRSASAARSWSGTRPRTTVDGAALRRPRRRHRPRRWCPGRSASSAARSTRSTTATSRSPRRRARRWACRASCCCPGGRAAAQVRAGRVTPAEHRLAMVEAAVAGNPRLGCSPMSSTAAALVLHGRHPRGATRREGCRTSLVHPLVRCPGGLPTWKRPDRILELARLAVLPRGGEPAIDERWVTTHFPGREDRIRFLPGPRLPISGSVIRRRVAAGRSIRYLVPDAVARYIAQHRLYLEPA